MHYEESEEEQTLLLKMKLPSKWAGYTVDYLKELFVEDYNKKPDNWLDSAQIHLEKKGDTLLFDDELLHTAVQKYDDLFSRLVPRHLDPYGWQRVQCPLCRTRNTSSAKTTAASRNSWTRKTVTRRAVTRVCRHCSMGTCRFCSQGEPDDGTSETYRWQGKLCQLWLSAGVRGGGNHDTSCRHHAAAPIFHDAVKYDFDSFLTLPDCIVSAHTDVKTA
ncbi:unnamed protein product [Peronospora destructor]|uniref:Uncharacterized protein n=1 Tax=Peronospora destructor TaxID=86335 RepID=A0AAV0UPT8_9STRA|nr:unnamed protein product [Peronospora destructor]